MVDLENIDALLKKSAQAFSEASPVLARNPNPSLTLENDANANKIDAKKEYSALYRARLAKLRPIVKQAAQKKWGIPGINYNASLLSIRQLVSWAANQ